jgi:competence protein ComEC
MNRAGAAALPGLLGGVMVGIAAADAGLLAPTLAVAGAACGISWAVARVSRRSLGPVVGVLGLAFMVGSAVGGVRGTGGPAPDGPGSVASLPSGEPVRVSGVVTDEPTPRGDALDLVVGEVHADGHAVTGKLLVRVPRVVTVTSGDELAVQVTVRAADPADVDEAAYRERLRRQGIGGVATAWEARVIGHRSVPVADAFAGLRRWLLDGLVRTVPEPEASLGAGILLGVRAGIDPEIRDAFAVAGLSHVVAISGWNVAIVVALIASATRRLRERMGPVVPALVAATAICAYVVLVGASPAVVRAALMAGALLAARLGGSPAHAASALMAAVVVMLLVTPTALWDIGFQLSALATGGLILLAAPIESRLARWPVWIRTPVALTVAAQLATLPVLLATFGQVSLVAPLANVIVVPLIPAVMAGAALASLVGAIAGVLPVPPLADLASWLAGAIAWLPLRALIVAGVATAAVPLAALPVSGAPWFTVAWYPCLGLAVRRLARRPTEAPPALESLEANGGGDRHLLPEAAALGTATAVLGRPKVLILVVVAAVTVATVLTGPDGRLHVTVLDIGQGDAILIEAPDGSMALVDAGVDPDLTLRRIGQFLSFHDRGLDVVVLSHPHQDHLGGLEEVFRRYAVGAFVDGGRPAETVPHQRVLDALAREPGARLVEAEAGQSIPVGPVILEVVYPTAEDTAAPPLEGDVNNTSVVIRLRYGRFTMLLTGDAEAPVESLLLERGVLGPVDVLKVGHHGSDSSSTPAFLATLVPAVAIISDGAGNDYGHPHRSTLDHLAEIPGLRLFRTDRDGSIEVTTDGAWFWVNGAGGRLGPLPAGGGPTAGGTGYTIPRDERIGAPGPWR